MSLNRYLKSRTLQFYSVYQSDTTFLIILGKDIKKIQIREMEARPPVPPSEGAQKWPETSELHSFRRSRENAGKHDSFRRSKRRRILQNGLTEAAGAMRRFHSFRRSKENAGKHDSFRRSKRRRILQNGLPEAVGALQQFYSFRRSRENAGKHDSFRRSKRRRILQNGLTEAAGAMQ